MDHGREDVSMLRIGRNTFIGPVSQWRQLAVPRLTGNHTLYTDPRKGYGSGVLRSTDPPVGKLTRWWRYLWTAEPMIIAASSHATGEMVWVRRGYEDIAATIIIDPPHTTRDS